jgi:hypothetical protein
MCISSSNNYTVGGLSERFNIRLSYIMRLSDKQIKDGGC